MVVTVWSSVSTPWLQLADVKDMHTGSLLQVSRHETQCKC